MDGKFSQQSNNIAQPSALDLRFERKVTIFFARRPGARAEAEGGGACGTKCSTQRYIRPNSPLKTLHAAVCFVVAPRIVSLTRTSRLTDCDRTNWNARTTCYTTCNKHLHHSLECPHASLAHHAIVFLFMYLFSFISLNYIFDVFRCSSTANRGSIG